jgi:hypothetical protein
VDALIAKTEAIIDISQRGLVDELCTAADGVLARAEVVVAAAQNDLAADVRPLPRRPATSTPDVNPVSGVIRQESHSSEDDYHDCQVTTSTIPYFWSKI